jgi:hypothetical protein
MKIKGVYDTDGNKLLWGYPVDASPDQARQFLITSDNQKIGVSKTVDGVSAFYFNTPEGLKLIIE